MALGQVHIIGHSESGTEVDIIGQSESGTGAG